jgi:hypothetical protein
MNPDKREAAVILDHAHSISANPHLHINSQQFTHEYIM